MELPAKKIEQLIKDLSLPTTLITALNLDITDAYYKGIENIEIVVNRNIINVNPETIQFLKQYNFDLIKGINADLAKKLRNILTNKLMQNTPKTQVIKQIQEAFNASKVRAEMIARTETMRAFGIGQLEAAKASGLQMKKYWLTARDERRCPICSRLGNKHSNLHPINIDKNFVDSESGTSVLTQPAHPRCRCKVIFVPVGIK